MDDEIILQSQLRAYTQRGGPRPDRPVRYAGANEQYISFGDVTNPERAMSTVWWFDPFRRNHYRPVARQISPPDSPKVTISFARRRGGISWVVGDLSCPMNFYEQAIGCGSAGDFLYGWSDFLTIYSHGLAGARSSKSRTTQSESNPLMDDVEFTFSSIYDIGGLDFRELARDQITRPILDVAFAPPGCEGCRFPWLYALVSAVSTGSPSIPAEIAWTIDGQTVNQAVISGVTEPVDPRAIEIVGDFIVVLDPVVPSYWFARLDPWSGAPTGWSATTSGFASTRPPTDMYAAGPGTLLFSAQGGYIYRSTNLPLGVSVVHRGDLTTSTLNRIRGRGDTVVAVGNGVVLKSLDRGESWTRVTSPTSANLVAVGVVDEKIFWVGSSTGQIWWTTQGGVSWSSLVLPSVSRIEDIVFATDEVGYILARQTDVLGVELWTTFNGGADWSSTRVDGNPRLVNYPNEPEVTRLAVPGHFPPSVSANILAVAGPGGPSNNGILLIAESTVL